MIDLQAIRTTVVKGLKEYLGIPVIRSNQTGEPPPYPYVSYTIITPMSQNKGTWGKYTDGKERKPTTQTWSVTIQSNDNAEAVELAIKAHEWFDHIGTVYFDDNSIVVQSVGNISNRDNMITIEYEYRNGFDVVLWLLSEIDDTTAATGTIETAVIQHEEE